MVFNTLADCVAQVFTVPDSRGLQGPVEGRLRRSFCGGIFVPLSEGVKLGEQEPWAKHPDSRFCFFNDWAIRGVGWITEGLGGRVGLSARALFYWYMLKQGYWLTEYLSISRVISKSKNAYEKAYLQTETDDNDVGYFIAYHLRVLELAFKELQQYIKRKIIEKQEATIFLSLGHINEHQAGILKLMADQPRFLLTVKDVQNRCMVSHTTAKLYIDGLVKQGYLVEIQLNKRKKGYVRSDDFEKLINGR